MSRMPSSGLPESDEQYFFGVAVDVDSVEVEHQGPVDIVVEGLQVPPAHAHGFGDLGARRPVPELGGQLVSNGGEGAGLGSYAAASPVPRAELVEKRPTDPRRSEALERDAPGGVVGPCRLCQAREPSRFQVVPANVARDAAGELGDHVAHQWEVGADELLFGRNPVVVTTFGAIRGAIAGTFGLIQAVATTIGATWRHDVAFGRRREGAGSAKGMNHMAPNEPITPLQARPM